VGAYFLAIVDEVVDTNEQIRLQREKAAISYAKQALGGYGYKEISEDAVVSDSGSVVQVSGQAKSRSWAPFTCVFNVQQNDDQLSWELENVVIGGKQVYQREPN